MRKQIDDLESKVSQYEINTKEFEKQIISLKTIEKLKKTLEMEIIGAREDVKNTQKENAKLKFEY